MNILNDYGIVLRNNMTDNELIKKNLNEYGMHQICNKYRLYLYIRKKDYLDNQFKDGIDGLIFLLNTQIWGSFII